MRNSTQERGKDMLLGKKLLFVGETCFAQTTEFKGTNSFSAVRFHESGHQLKVLLGQQGFEVTHIPCHLVHRDYPRTVQGLAAYDAILFSDVGADTFLLLPDMVRTGVRVPNLLKVTAEYDLPGHQRKRAVPRHAHRGDPACYDTAV
jgi:uncharacterized membrane protein